MNTGVIRLAIASAIGVAVPMVAAQGTVYLCPGERPLLTDRIGAIAAARQNCAVAMDEVRGGIASPAKRDKAIRGQRATARQTDPKAVSLETQRPRKRSRDKEVTAFEILNQELINERQTLATLTTRHALGSSLEQVQFKRTIDRTLVNIESIEREIAYRSR